MDRCLKDEPTGKNLVCKESSCISEKKLENPVEGGWHPPPPLGHQELLLYLAVQLDLLIVTTWNRSYLQSSQYN